MWQIPYLTRTLYLWRVTPSCLLTWWKRPTICRSLCYQGTNSNHDGSAPYVLTPPKQPHLLMPSLKFRIEYMDLRAQKHPDYRRQFYFLSCQSQLCFHFVLKSYLRNPRIVATQKWTSFPCFWFHVKIKHSILHC